MKKGLMGVLAAVVLVGILFAAAYNGLVGKSEKVDAAWANVEVNLQRRAELIPNLVSTVQGYADHEKEVFDRVLEARTKLTGAKTMQDMAAADEELSSALKGMMVIVENYPDLKASANFVQLSDELAGTENRIATSRGDYNDAVREYNSAIKRLPGNLLADMFGFEAKDYFEADEKAVEVPTVSFQ